MDYNEWKTEAERLLAELGRIDFGYPLGENVVKNSVSGGSVVTYTGGVDPAIAEQLDSFFTACDGLSWPDVHNGYFIKPRSELGQVKDEYEPTQINGNVGGAIIVFGSSGTGTLFALRVHVGDVVVLPAGRVERNTYYDHSQIVRVVADDFEGFIQRLLEDLRAFIKDMAAHNYIA